MNELWAAIIGGLIGSVVGGLFTAIAAVMQVRGTLQAARIQADLTYTHSLQVHERERAVEAARECLDINHALWTSLAEVLTSHRGHPAGSVACSALITPEVEALTRRLRRFTYIGKHELPTPAQELVTLLDDQADLLTSGNEALKLDAASDGGDQCVHAQLLRQAMTTSERLESAIVDTVRTPIKRDRTN